MIQVEWLIFFVESSYKKKKFIEAKSSQLISSMIKCSIHMLKLYKNDYQPRLFIS
jgi:hypothetical protein